MNRLRYVIIILTPLEDWCNYRLAAWLSG